MASVIMEMDTQCVPIDNEANKLLVIGKTWHLARQAYLDEQLDTLYQRARHYKITLPAVKL